MNSHLRASGDTARIIIANVHAMVSRKYRGVPLWSMVGHIFGHGSGYSIEICISAGLDPHQKVGKALKPLPKKEAAK